MNLLYHYRLPLLLGAAVVVWCAPLLLVAQPSEQIVPNPAAVTLRHIWKVTGKEEQDRVGIAAGSLGDISGDGLGDFAVADIQSGSWKVYMGGNPAPDTVADWVFENFSGSLSSPVVGDFFGTGEKVVAFARDSCDANSICFFRLFFFKTVNGRLDTVPIAVLNTGIQFCARDVLAADLDGDGADELILSRSCSFPEIWIYKGGAEFLPSGQPDILIADQDNNSSSPYDLHVIDADNDTYLDMIVIAGYSGRPKLKVWFGGPESPWNWSDTPDRVLLLDGTGLNLQPVIADFDGDHVPDIATTLYGGDTAGIYVYRSGSGKDFRTRSFAPGDADRVLLTTHFHTHVYGAGGGYLNDSSRRYAMLPLVGASFFDPSESMLLLFSGGKQGPNATYDALYAPSRDGVTPGSVMRLISPLPDCNGDGWDDLLISDHTWWWDVLSYGIAMVLAGGPEIPNDDPTVSVREEPVAGEAGGLYLWPNPVVDELNIAWRGNLKKMPQSFTAHDMAGKRVAAGDVEPYLGAALWKCGDLPAGAYVLTAYNKEGEVIATARVIKQ